LGVLVFKPQHRRKTMSLTPEQKRRKAEELRRRAQNLQGGSMSYYVDKSDDMVAAHQPVNECPRVEYTGIQDSTSDSGSSCDSD
jgi:hypothetical protein